MGERPSKKGIALVAVLCAILVVALGVYILNRANTPEDTSPETSSQPSSGASTVAQTPGVSDAPPNNSEVSSTQVFNVVGKPRVPDASAAYRIYLGSYGVEKALIVYGNDSLKEVRYMDGAKVEMVDVQRLTRETLILSFSQGYITIRSFLFSGDAKQIIVSLTRGNIGKLLAEVYHVDVSTFGKTNATALVSFEIMPASNHYGDWKGIPAVVNLVEDKYAILSTPRCIDCEAEKPRAQSILNIKTGKELFLGESGDLKFNLSSDTLSYKTMGTIQVSCTSDDYEGPTPVCRSGSVTKTVYGPTGEVKTARLP